MLIDCHVHLHAFTPDQLAADTTRAQTLGLSAVIAAGMNLETSRFTVALAERNEFVYAAVGIHPWEAIPIDSTIRQQLFALAQNPGVVALSEMGLDFKRFPQTREVQKQAYIAQLEIAREVGLPVIVHSRDAHDESMEILRRHGSGVQGAIHGFSGSLDELQDWLRLGFYVSIGRKVLDLANLPEILSALSADRLVLETDANAQSKLPDGTRLDFAQLRTAADRVAEILAVSVEELGQRTTANLKRLVPRLGA